MLIMEKILSNDSQLDVFGGPPSQARIRCGIVGNS